MAASRDRRALWGWLGLSLAGHVIGLAALGFVIERGASHAETAAGGGVVVVELVPGKAASEADARVRTASSTRVSAADPERSDGSGRPPGAVSTLSATRSASTARGSTPSAGSSATPRASAPAVEASRASRDAPAADSRTDAGPRSGPAALPRVLAKAGPTAPTSASARVPGASGSALVRAGAAWPRPPDGPIDRVARPASPIRPRYPAAARERGDEASVVVEAWVAASGRVEHAQVHRGAGADFDAAALHAVREALFHPARQDGAPVASRVALRLHFSMER